LKPLLAIAFALSFSACETDEIEDLQGQIDDLTEQVEAAQ